MHAISHGVYGHRERVTLKVDSLRKIPCRTGESNLRQRSTGPTLYPLSYIPTPFFFLSTTTTRKINHHFCLFFFPEEKFCHIICVETLTLLTALLPRTLVFLCEDGQVLSLFFTSVHIESIYMCIFLVFSFASFPPSSHRSGPFTYTFSKTSPEFVLC